MLWAHRVEQCSVRDNSPSYVEPRLNAYNFPTVINCDSGAVYKIVITSALGLRALISAKNPCVRAVCVLLCYRFRLMFCRESCGNEAEKFCILLAHDVEQSVTWLLYATRA